MWRLGHRGACGYAPENTLLSFRKALELGVHGFEFDIQLSRDGVPMVIHDDTLERTTSGKGRVCDFTAAELQLLDAGQGEKIPTFTNVLDMVDKRCRMLVELKAEQSAFPVAETIKYYVDHMGWSYEQFFVCSFDHLQLVSTRTINPNIHTCALLVGIPVSLAALAQEAGAMAINPNIYHMNTPLVEDAHKRGLKVYVWTCNTLEEIAAAKAYGVDGIMSNFPDRI
jgi:glycerophosphoryl diester phosphodiesterase